MNPVDLEATYESLAHKIDEVGEPNTELFLAKLVLLLAHSNGNALEVQACIDNAAATFTTDREVVS